MTDLLGYFLRSTPDFRGKGRLVFFWATRARNGDRRIRVLPGGAKISCDMSVPYESMVWLQQEEESDLAALRRLLHPGETFVDCGANIGLWTLEAAAAVEPEGRVFSFEPHPVTFPKLTENVRSNHWEKRVRLQNAACGESEGNLPFQCAANHNISHLTRNSGEDVRMVKVIPLDHAIRGEKVHGIKIDVEGYELEVLRGAMETLQSSWPWLCVEFNTLVSHSNRLGDWAVHQFLTSLGYVCCPMADAPEHPDDRRLSDDWTTQGYCNLFYFIP
ncbi:MAG: FkbM family methyltransferase [Verrucomicrobiota bacterium]